MILQRQSFIINNEKTILLITNDQKFTKISNNHRSIRLKLLNIFYDYLNLKKKHVGKIIR